MTHLKTKRMTNALVKVWDAKAEKTGLHRTMYSVNGDQYIGEWIDNKKHGKGKQFWKKAGEIYDGDWIKGKREGFGILSRIDHKTKEFVKVYIGSWKNNKKDGTGMYIYSPFEFYEGDWHQDERSGWGRMHYMNGELYEGEWLKDKQHGRGLLLLANGNRFIGGWSKGKKNGAGQFFYLDRGQLYDGFWLNGVAKCGSISDFRREAAVKPTVCPLPRVCLQDPQAVLMEVRSLL
ncbi:hypothetical protein DNTS_008584 [Danionella cerebrum]|uniref:MORN repeat-containing protein 3 n=1 Tax=Danionella cerebrum TaxID=2873325 RepID=A0A553Q6B3_9TELE|nr:hypothetical protein DNTS_008584 [Danionella translucida]TRY85472.1 hypothetical protein DNTS_008584 [Danionella translucida]